MTNEEQILSLLTQINERLDGLAKGQDAIRADVSRVEALITETRDMLQELEAKNIMRHMEMTAAIDGTRRDVTTLETIAGKSLQDIAALKLAKAPAN